MSINMKIIFKVLMVTWIILGIMSFYLFQISKNYSFKTKYFKYFLILTTILFILYIGLMRIPLIILLISSVIIIIIQFLNYKNTRFCDKCGSTVLSRMLISRAEFCSKCGEKLKK